MSLRPLVLLEHNLGNLFVFKVKQCSSGTSGQSGSGERRDWYLKFCDCMPSILSSVLLSLACLVVPMMIACVFLWA